MKPKKEDGILQTKCLGGSDSFLEAYDILYSQLISAKNIYFLNIDILIIFFLKRNYCLLYFIIQQIATI